MNEGEIFTSQAPVVSQPSAAPMQPLPKEKRPWILIIGLIVSAILLIAAGGFGYWSYSQMLDYKNNSDTKAQAAVEKANQELTATLEADFAEQEKSPLKSYTSPSQFGSVSFKYPKTWSAYVIEQATGSGNHLVDGYYYPDFVPNTSGDNTAYYLRVQVNNGTYKAALDQYKTYINQNKLKSSPFQPQNVEGATAGVRLDGQLSAKKQGSMIILPLRDKVLKIWAETEVGVADLDNHVLPNLSFSP